MKAFRLMLVACAMILLTSAIASAQAYKSNMHWFEAKRQLAMLRSCPDANGSPEIYPRLIEDNAAAGGFTLRQLGTSKAGLRRRALRCHRIAAETLLAEMRDASVYDRENTGSLFLRSAIASRLSLSYYGLSRRERIFVLTIDRNVAIRKARKRAQRVTMITRGIELLLFLRERTQERRTKRVPNGPPPRGIIRP